MNVFVSGGSKGIGKAIVLAFLKKGFFVYFSGTTSEQLIKNDSDFSLITNWHYFQVDFSDNEKFLLFLNMLKAKMISFDILVNNAGINKINELMEITDNEFENILTVNLFRSFQLSRAIIPYMASKKYGRVINLSSIFGIVSKEKRTSYSCSKFALVGLTKALAIEFASSNVLINAISPGFIETELTRSILPEEELQGLLQKVPLRRLGTTEEIASLVMYLTIENTFITGQNICIDGGFTCV